MQGEYVLRQLREGLNPLRPRINQLQILVIREAWCGWSFAFLVIVYVSLSPHLPPSLPFVASVNTCALLQNVSASILVSSGLASFVMRSVSVLAAGPSGFLSPSWLLWVTMLGIRGISGVVMFSRFKFTRIGEPRTAGLWGNGICWEENR